MSGPSNRVFALLCNVGIVCSNPLQGIDIRSFGMFAKNSINVFWIPGDYGEEVSDFRCFAEQIFIRSGLNSCFQLLHQAIVAFVVVQYMISMLLLLRVYIL